MIMRTGGNTLFNSIQPYFWFVFLVVLLVTPSTAAFKYLHEGMRAPAFEGVDLLTGEKVSSAQLQEENVLIVVFWASWSQRSLEELESLAEIYHQFEGKNLRVLAVNVEGQTITSKKRSEIKDFVEQARFPFPILLDEGLDIYYSFGVIAVPSTAIMDSTGFLRYAPAGYSLVTRDLIVDSIEVLMGLKKETIASVVSQGYQPKKTASRYYQLASKLNQQRMYERAQANLTTAIDADPKFSGPHSLRGEILLKLDSIEAAQKEFGIAVTLDTTSVVAWTGWGKAFLVGGELDSAYQKLSYAVGMDDTYTPAFLNLGLCLSMQGHSQEALDSLNKARELNLMNPRVYQFLGKAYLQAADSIQAANSFMSALEILYPDK